MSEVDIKPEDVHVPGWHHIDTAPKDGVEIEVLNNRWWSQGYRKTDTVFWRQFSQPRRSTSHAYDGCFLVIELEGEWVPVDGDIERWMWSHWRPKPEAGNPVTEQNQ